MTTGKNLILCALLLAIGFVVAATCISFTMVWLKNQERTVIVKGLAEIERPADHVIWPITYTVTGNDLASVFNQLEEKNQIIMEFLTSNGIADDQISINAPSVTDTQIERYGATPEPSTRYFSNQVITVSTPMVDKVRELMVKQTQLIKSNIAISTNNWQFQTKFLFNGLDDVKPAMIEQATKNARASAEKFADDSNSQLGKIKRATQGQLTIENRDDNTPFIKTLRVVTTVEYTLSN